jgi:hypothetical protein
VRHDGTDERDPNLMPTRTSSPKMTTAPPSWMSWPLNNQ